MSKGKYLVKNVNKNSNVKGNFARFASQALYATALGSIAYGAASCNYALVASSALQIAAGCYLDNKSLLLTDKRK